MYITRTFRNSTIVLLLFLTAFEAQSQWNQYCIFNLPAPPFPPPPMWSASFVDAEFNSKDTGVYIYSVYTSPSSGSSGTLMQTSNAASSWAMSNSWSGVGYGTYGIQKLPLYNTFYVINNNQGSTSLVKSNDGGLTWQSAGSLGYWFGGFFACDTSKYYSVYGGPSSYYLLKYDNGTKYMQHATFTTMRPSQPFFPDTSVGFLIAQNTSMINYSIILKTTNGGSNWSPVFNDSTVNIRKTFFVDTLNGYACGDSGLILKTIDGGLIWQYMNSGVSINLNSIFCINEFFVLAAGDSGIIIRTIDGGANWTQDQSGTTQNFRKIYVVNDSIGMAMTNGIQYSLNIYGSTDLWENLNQLNEKFVVFPNPVSNYINFYLDDPEDRDSCDLRVYDNMGKLICQKLYIKNQSENSLDVSHLSNGIYYLFLKCKNGILSKSIIVDKSY